MKKILALMALMTLTACDYANRADQKSEQDDRLYKAAMEDYRSGRLEAALRGFEKAIANDPANASARFQYACLLQDSRHDFAGAWCAYREYLMQQPSSDKARLAKDRLALCEKEFAKELSVRYGLGGNAVAADSVEALQKDLRAAEGRAAELEKKLNAAEAKVKTLTDEKARLESVVKGIGGGDDAPSPTAIAKEARELLEESDEDETPPPADEARALAKERDEESGSALLSNLTTAKDGKKAKEPKKAEKAGKEQVERPKTYQVVEGDTLYGVAKRFYGTITVWKKIRDANKALISADNRLRVGDTIVLPEP